MTPIQRLGTSPSDEIIAHELGHLVIGLEMGLPEGGIEFTEGHPTEVARAHYSSAGVSIEQALVRALAGMYSQSLCIPESIGESLRERILTARIFDDVPTIGPDSPTSMLMSQNGFIGDSMFAIERAGRQESPQLQLDDLQHSHLELIELARRTDLKATVLRVLRDVREWMVTEDEDLLYSPMIIYSVVRATAVWKNLRP